MLIPWDFQEAAIQSIFLYFKKKTGNPIVALPTGTGKSIVLTEFIRRALIKYPGTRILKLTHVKELIEQNFETLKKLWPNAPAGIYSSGLSKKQLGLPITFGGVQSIIKADMHSLGRIDLLIIDECHLVSPKDSTTYQKIIAKLKAVNPYLKVIGFTATQYRLGDGLLIDQEDGLFTDTCFDITHLEGFNWLLKNAYLSPLIPKKTQTQIDLTGVHKSGGDFKLNELQSAVDKEEITRNALLEMIEYGQDRDHWLIFSTGIEHAENISNMLNDFGLASTFIHSKLPDAERDKRLLDYKAGKFRAMVNNGILTTGFNFPSIDLIGVLRPTESASLWVQLLGRGTRPVFSPGYDLSTVEGRKMAIQASPKKNCLVMDFANNTHRLGPINDPVIPKKRGKGGNGMAPVKLCPQCATYNHASARFCIGCGEEFIAQVKIRSEAGTAELIRKEKEKPVHEIFKVDRVTYAKHIKHSTGSESLKVSYFCGMRMFTEWIQINNPGSRSKRWLSIRLGNHPIPTDIDDAMECLPFFRVPIYIKVEIVKNGYDNVLSYDFTGTIFNPENKK